MVFDSRVWTRVINLGISAAALACSAVASADCPYQVTSRSGGTVSNVALSANKAILSLGAKLVVADVSNLMSPTVLGDVTLDADISDIETTSSVAYVAAFQDGLILVDHANPAAPFIVASVNGFTAIQVEFSGAYAYVVDASDWGNLHLRIFNVGNPANPIQVASLPVENSGLRISGGRLFSLNGVNGDVQIMSLVNPEAPALLGSFNAGVAQDIAVAINTAYVAAGAAGVKSFNISNPSIVTPLGTLDNGAAYEVRLNGTRLYVGDFQEFDVLNVANPSSMTLLGTHAPADDFYPTDFELMSSPGVVSFAVAARTRLQILDCTIPSALVPRGRIDGNGTNYDVATYGDYAYVANQLGIDVFHLAAPGGPAKVAALPIAGDFQSVTREGDRLYVGCAAGLRIYGLANPANPLFFGAIAASSARFPTITGNLAYLCGEQKLRIVNVTDAVSPILISTLQLPEGSYRSALRGQYLYVTTFSDTLYIVNVSNPAAPAIAATMPSANWTGGVGVMADYLLVGESGLRIYSLANPLVPVLVGSDGATGSFMLDLEVHGTQVCATQSALVKIFDLTAPTLPLMTASISAARYSHAAAITGNNVIAVDDSCGVMFAQPSCKGDMNCDGLNNGLDIRAFVQAVLDPSAYAISYPGCDILNGDMTGDGMVTAADLAGIVDSMLQ